jgi:hypothetical protein
MNAAQDFELRPNQQAFVNRFVETCQADARVVAAFLGGSHVKGSADPYSDVDLGVITTDASYREFFEGREAFLRSLGELLFLEDFGIPDIAFFIFADDTEGELNFGSESKLGQIHSGPYRTLLDKKNILADAVFPEKEADFSRQISELRHNIDWFWHECSHFITAMRRGQLWWARGQLDELRAKCVNLARLRNDFWDDGVGEEPYFKIEAAIDPAQLAPLELTFVPMQRDAMLQSAQILVQFYLEVAQSLSQTHKVPYPHGLERLMLARFGELTK